MAVFASSCGKSSDLLEDPIRAEKEKALLAQWTDTLFTPSIEIFVNEAKSFKRVAQTMHEAPSMESLEDTQVAWGKTMQAWQRIELWQLGPLGSEMQGGLGLRNKIYVWPLFNRCKTDQMTTNQSYTSLESNPDLSVRGLSALEYLLFVEGTDNGCTSTTDINANGAWNDLVTSGRLDEQRRAQIMAIATELETNAEAILNAWRPYAAELREASSSRFTRVHEALNTVTAAMFYIESDTKDMKLAIPLGISERCTSTRCPNLLESLYADASGSNIKNNIEAFLAMVPGLAQLCEDVGNSDLKSRLLAATQTLADIREPWPSFAEDLERDAQFYTTVYEALKPLTTLLKTEVITVLDLDLPAKLETDND